MTRRACGFRSLGTAIGITAATQTSARGGKSEPALAGPFARMSYRQRKMTNFASVGWSLS